jgi:ABC-type cobalt transport system, permease component CbiQ and related transporters
MSSRLLINLIPGKTLLHRLTGTTKVRFFIILLVYIIMSFDIRLLLPLCVIGIIALQSLKPNWNILKYFFVIAFIMNLLNISLYWLVDPHCGAAWCGGGNTVLYKITDHYVVTLQSIWYLSIRFFKMMTSLVISMVFVLSITPSEMAAGLYSIKVPYKICTIFSMAFRYIPDIHRDFDNIKVSMQIRGIELDPKKASLIARLKHNVFILAPLIITSFDRIGNIANAMDLRGYGKNKERTYYSEPEEQKADKIAKVLYCLLLVFCIYWIIVHNIMPHTSKMWYPFS